jgi:hypothetical protein
LEEVGTSVRRESEEVEHGGGLRNEVERGEGEREDGVEVSGVLREVARFNRVVSRVVRSRSDLVEKE